MAMIQLLLGNMGMAGGGVNALRGHSIFRADGPGAAVAESAGSYMTPSEKQTDLQTYLYRQHAETAAGRPVNYWGNYPKFFVSMMKAFFGDKSDGGK